MAIVYVRGDGDDVTGDGTTPATAYATVGQAMEDVADLSADEIRICSGNGNIEENHSGHGIDMLESWTNSATWTDMRDTLWIRGCNASGTPGAGTPTWTLAAGAGSTDRIIDITGGATAINSLLVEDVILDANGKGYVALCTMSTGMADGNFTFRRCQLTNAVNGLVEISGASGYPPGFTFIQCELDNAGDFAFVGPTSWTAVHATTTFLQCAIHDNTSGGLTNTPYGTKVVECWLYNHNTSGDFAIQMVTGITGFTRNVALIYGNTFYDNDTDIYDPGTLAGAQRGSMIAINNILSEGADGFSRNLTGTANYWGARDWLYYELCVDYNCLHSKSSNNYEPGLGSDLATGDNDISTDPSFTSTVTPDFTPGSSWTGLEGGLTGGWTTVSGGSVTQYKDIGAVQRQPSGGGGSDPISAAGLHPIEQGY